MATLTTTNIIGSILLPDGSIPAESYVHFHLDGHDTDAIDDVTIPPYEVESFLDAAGDLDADLWPNERGVRGTLYSVVLGISDGQSIVKYSVGKILVPEVGPIDLNDLLPLTPPDGLTLEDYLAQLAAAVAAAEAALLEMTLRENAFLSRADFEAATIPDEITSWSVVNNGEYCLYVRDALGTAIESANGVKGSPLGKHFIDHWADNTTPESTDTTAASQAAIVWARTHGGVVFGTGTDSPYLISDTLVLGAALDGMSFDNIRFVAGGASVWGDDADGYTKPMLDADGTDKVAFGKVEIDCAFKSSGAFIANQEGCVFGDEFLVEHWDTRVDDMSYGVRTKTKAGQLVIGAATARQYAWGETGFDNQANRTGHGWKIETADFLMNGTIGNYTKYPFHKSGFGSWQASNCHMFNGALTTVTDASAIYSMYIEDPSNGQITALYGDNSTVYVNGDDLHAGNATLIINGMVGHENANGDQDVALRIETSVTDNNLAGLTLSNVILADATAAALDVTGAGSYSSEMKFNINDVATKNGSMVTALDCFSNVAGQVIVRDDGMELTGLLTGTAVTQSQTDTTADRLLKVGDFGLGALSSPTISDIDASLRSGFYRTVNTTTGVFPVGASLFGKLTVLAYDINDFLQIYQSVLSDEIFVRRYRSASGGVQEWHKLFTTDNILDAVSLSSGVPTGGIIETGSNANGTYTKFADGTMLCKHVLTLDAPSTANGSVFQGATQTTWTFPVAFTDTPSIHGTNLTGAGNIWHILFCGSGTSGSVKAVRPTTSATAPTATVTATGRWD